MKSRLVPLLAGCGRTALRALGLVALAASAAGAAAQDFPSRPIRIVVPFSAGGGVDALARMVGQKVSEQVGQSVQVENRPGAGGNIAAAYAAQQPADGYTLLIGANGLAANTSLYANQPFEMLRDFTAVAYIGESPLILLSSPTFAPKTLPELVAQAKANPGRITYASGGSGTSGHLATELLKSMAQIDLTHVTYKGGAQAFVDLEAGRVDVMMIDPPLAMPQLRGQRLRAIAVGSTKRFVQLPDTPTIGESGIAGFNATVWWGFVVPAKTPREVVARLNAEINKALADPVLAEKLRGMGVTVAAQSPEQFGRFLVVETDKWATVIKRAGIRAD